MSGPLLSVPVYLSIFHIKELTNADVVVGVMSSFFVQRGEPSVVSKEERVNNFIKKQIDEGRQAYIVCPLVEENEELDLSYKLVCKGLGELQKINYSNDFYFLPLLLLSQGIERFLKSYIIAYKVENEEEKEYINKIKIDDDKHVNVLFCKTEKENLVCITIHHFLVDFVSWEVLMRDFSTIVKQLKNNEKISLPAKMASFKLWTQKLNEYADVMPLENKKYWRSVNDKLDSAKPLCSQEENEAEEFEFTFDKDISKGSRSMA